MNLLAVRALDEADRRGVVLTVTGPDSIHFKAPLGAMTPDLVADLKACKPDVIRLLSQQGHHGQEPHPAPQVLHHALKKRQADPHTLRLIAWFKEALPCLSRGPFYLAPWAFVSDPEKFFERLIWEANRYPYGDRPVGLGSDLVLLKSVVDADQITARKAAARLADMNKSDSEHECLFPRSVGMGTFPITS